MEFGDENEKDTLILPGKEKKEKMLYFLPTQ